MVNVSDSFIVMAILRNPPVAHFRAAYSSENIIQQAFTKPSFFSHSNGIISFENAKINFCVYKFITMEFKNNIGWAVKTAIAQSCLNLLLFL